MAKLRQLWLPRVYGVKKESKSRKSPQPRVEEFISKKQASLIQIKQFEIFHRPFDLRFRGILNKWLIMLKNEGNLKLKEILDNTQYKVIHFYLFSQAPEHKWLNQNEVITKINLASKKKLRVILISALIRIWKKQKRKSEVKKR